MRGIILGITFFSALPFVFIRGPFFGILMWFWVSLMDPQFLVWGSPFAHIPYALIVALATLVSWAMHPRELKLPPRDRVTVILLALMVWISLSSWFGIGPREGIDAYWIVAEKMLLMTLVAFTLTNTRERLDQLILVSALAVGFLGVRGGLGALLTGEHARGPGGMLSGNNELGDALAMFLPLLFYLRQRYAQPYFKWPLTAVIVFTFLGTLFTFSRGANLALAAVIGIAWYHSRHKLLTGVLVAGVAAGLFMLAPQRWTARMETLKNYHAIQDAQERLYLWRLGFAMAEKRPLLGGGFNWSADPAVVAQEFSGSDFHWTFSLPDAKHLAAVGIHLPRTDGQIDVSDLPPLLYSRALHSIWFEQLSDLGFPGLLLFLACGFTVLFNARWVTRHARRHPDLAWADRLARMMQASLVAYAIGGTFGSMNLYDGFYLLVILAAIARRIVAAELAKSPKEAAQPARLRAQGPLRPQPVH